MYVYIIYYVYHCAGDGGGTPEKKIIPPSKPYEGGCGWWWRNHPAVRISMCTVWRRQWSRWWPSSAAAATAEHATRNRWPHRTTAVCTRPAAGGSLSFVDHWTSLSLSRPSPYPCRLRKLGPNHARITTYTRTRGLPVPLYTPTGVEV